ncbi:MAG: ribosome silencing factor [Gammaproteobacteria bacterium]|nr:ribosome silencing factor [Gammaproteobacteria bacterium]|tara:strand:+ start:3067 stop:3411 length:345 start_codon:yes stop_codon:yes gene_type:complete
MKSLKQFMIDVLEDNKAENIISINVKNKSSITDIMILVSGRSTRHVQSIADNLINKLKKNKIKPLGIEGYSQSEWILIDYGDILIHVMHPDAREFYSIEKLWDESLQSDGLIYQ